MNNPVYAAMVEHLDQSVGRLTEKLDDLNLTDNTIFIYFSDNGGLFKRFDGDGPEVMSNEPLRAEKGTVYEGGIRVPFIIKWPDKIAAGKESTEPVCSIDLLPTILELSGNTLTKEASIDGVSLAPVVLHDEKLPARDLFWHYPHYHHCAPSGVVRSGRYKLIEEYEEGKLELYDLQADLGEEHNLVEDQPELAKELQQKLSHWREEVHANMPTENPNWNPERAGEWHRRP
ncbi:MAG: sulfatase-like hydrolase/transferase [Planctomycetaceae bacterium]